MLSNAVWPGRQYNPKEARKRSAAQGPHSEVVPRVFWKLVSKSCDECKGSFARGCETKRWSHWTCSSLGTIFQPIRINSVPGVKCFCNNKNVLRSQSMVWHFVRHPVYTVVELFCGNDSGLPYWNIPILSKTEFDGRPFVTLVAHDLTSLPRERWSTDKVTWVSCCRVL